MSAAKRHRVCTRNGTTIESSPPPSIPVDLLLEIFAHLDAAGIIRCAATSKPIRRAVIDPAFRRRLTLRDGGAGNDVILGVSYASRDKVGQVPRQNLRFDAGLLKSLEPVASRGGLVVLRRHYPAPELHVCNTITGRVSRVPYSAEVTDDYPPALLTVGDGGRSFQLLFADWKLRTQTYSSKDWRWGRVVDTHLPPTSTPTTRPCPSEVSQALVIGSTAVHWLYSYLRIIALDVGTARASAIELPPGCLKNVRSYPSQRAEKALQLAASADGRLSLLVAEAFAITMWTLSAASGEEPARWTWQMVIPRHAIGREAVAGPSYAVQFLAFGERKRVAILQMAGVGLVQINLGSKEARVLSSEFKEMGGANFLFPKVCLHEADLSSLLQAMKPF